jgi:hypothetical protein
LAVSSANSGTRRINSRLDNIDMFLIPSDAWHAMTSYNQSD